MNTYDLKPSRVNKDASLYDCWSVTKNGRHYCMASSRDHAEEIIDSLEAKERPLQREADRASFYWQMISKFPNEHEKIISDLIQAASEGALNDAALRRTIEAAMVRVGF